MTRRRWGLVLVVLAWAIPAIAGGTQCTTYEEKTMGRLQTRCDDGTRAVSTWSPTLR
jgi:DNA-binding transcriptional regulator of glucitol operon